MKKGEKHDKQTYYKQNAESDIQQQLAYGWNNINGMLTMNHFHHIGLITQLGIEGFLRSKVKDETAIVAMADNKIVGYMTYDEFPFNGEKSVFCPAIARTAVDEYKEEVYLTLYKSISRLDR